MNRLVASVVIVTLVLSITLAAHASSLTGKVIRVIDSDTTTVLDHNMHFRIRLAGIDAPERAQAFGTRSKQHLSRLVFAKTVNLACSPAEGGRAAAA